MALSAGTKLNPAKGFMAYFRKHNNGVITAKNGEQSLKPGWVQNADTGVVSQGTKFMDKVRRNPINTTIIAGGGLAAGSMAYGAFQNPAPGGDSFQSGGH
ncbi:MAG: hypothetical protein K0Q50_2987 [Vampirovibrio sp.]|jgi:hypothetical protein|nr:hypothetical protein [Vampirovibrio sp.]